VQDLSENHFECKQQKGVGSDFFDHSEMGRVT